MYTTPTNGSDVIDLRNEKLSNGITAVSVNALAGDDVIYGSSYYDIIQGSAGNDKIYGNGGDDCLLGQDGNDFIDGGVGNDFVHGGTGHDTLDGGFGLDTLCGGLGNDVYRHYFNNGNDVVNDDLSEALVKGYGGGIDTVIIFGVDIQNFRFYKINNDLYVLSVADAADGYMNDGVILQDHFLKGNNFIELVGDSKGNFVDTSVLVW